MTTIRNFLFVALALATAFCSTGLPASAHAMLESATPAVGATVTTAPTEIRLTFSEGVEAKFSGVQVTTAAGAAVKSGKPALDPADKKTLVIPISDALAPGIYKVKWHVVSVDTHKTQGAFSFTVGR
ncbi:copper resistance protein CopC [Methylocella silvestris BL2]|uniref:Copper resistance protein CopC n=1 Tax=Methylocella silvestris (strain DSM 15510 / CIP 108128 / LMG 27833 / NCIMB 13906 / BL2) TaxID=395965 RepID=B8EJN7_METSB|nr:copper homeostasis periplasmic binding protein CopC [Methylocella silvestris]ACK49441.1 copper resistance protein CopC [Methylocella silvestris BL2]